MLICFILIAILGANLLLTRREVWEYYLHKFMRKRVLPEARLEEVDPVFKAGPMGTTPACEAVFISKAGQIITGAVKDIESWILAVLAKKSHRIFEFGTCTGRTTYHLARNSSDQSIVTTLTLAPNSRDAYAAEAGDDPTAIKSALSESNFQTFFYSGTPVERKIKQLFGDSKTFDETPYLKSCDLIFVDGSHAYSHVKSDSEKALRMIKPGGIILWHDYHLVRTVLPDVYKALNELAAKYPLKQVSGTSFVMYRKPL